MPGFAPLSWNKALVTAKGADGGPVFRHVPHEHSSDFREIYGWSPLFHRLGSV